MLVKRIKLILLILITVLSATGCWDSVDAEDKDIAISVIVDKTDEGYAFYVRIPSFSSGQQGGSQEKSGGSYKTIKGEGKTFIEAREDLDRQSDQPVYLGATQSIIFTERFAYSGVEDYLIRVRQMPDYRKTLDVVVTSEDPEKLMEYQPENAPSVGFAIETTIQSLIDTGQTYHFSLGDILMTLASTNKCYLLHTIGLKTDIAMTGYSVFDDGHCIGFIPIEQGKGILLLKSRDPKPYYSVQFIDGTASLRVWNVSRNIKPSYIDGKVVFDVSFDISSQVLSLSKSEKISEPARQDLASSLERKVMNDVSEAILTSERFGCDYLGFYTAFRITYPEQIKSMNWKEEYKKAVFNISVKAKVDLVSTVNYGE